MSQISQPVRIILIAGVVFLAAWFTVLRPKAETIEPTTTTTTAAPPTTGPGKAVEAAKDAAAQAGGQTETDPKTGAATTTTPETKPQTPTPVAIPAEELAKLPKDVAEALEAKKTLVLAVLGDKATPWRPLADDDRYVRNHLRKVNRYDGSVLVKQVPADSISTYGPLVNDLGVNQTPSVVVIDPTLKGKVLTGYVDRIAINQAIADARDAGIEPDITDSYLRELNQLCGDFSLRVGRWSAPTIRGKKAKLAAVDRMIAINRTIIRRLTRTDAPREWRSMKAEMLKVRRADGRAMAALRKAGKSGKASDFKAFEGLVNALDGSKLDRRFDKAGLTNCASNRRS